MWLSHECSSRPRSADQGGVPSTAETSAASEAAAATRMTSCRSAAGDSPDMRPFARLSSRITAWGADRTGGHGWTQVGSFTKSGVGLGRKENEEAGAEGGEWLRGGLVGSLCAPWRWPGGRPRRPAAP